MAVATPNGVSVFFRYARTERAAIQPSGHSRTILTRRLQQLQLGGFAQRPLVLARLVGVQPCSLVQGP
jgi:hypothetical protein